MRTLPEDLREVDQTLEFDETLHVSKTSVPFLHIHIKEKNLGSFHEFLALTTGFPCVFFRRFGGRTSDSNDLDHVLKAEVAMITNWQDDIRSLG